jgi:HlyD family secretion protein
MPARLSSRLLAVAVAAAVAGGIAWGLAPRPVAVELRPVRRGTLVVRVADDGVTRIKERHLVSAPLAGQMGRVSLEAGDAVTASKTVVTTIEPTDPALLDPRAEAEARARVEAAQAARELAGHALHRARVQVTYTAADLARARELFPTKAVTREQLDAAERAWLTAVEDVDEAEQEVHVAEHLVGMMEAALVRTRAAGGPAVGDSEWRLDVTVPVDGRVLRVLREDAGVVTAGTPLVEVGDPRNLDVVIDLVSEDAARVAAGDRCEITAWGGGRPLAGTVRVVEPRGFTKVSPLGVEEQRVNVIVDFAGPAEERAALGDDFRVEAAITVDELDDAVRVPLAALFRHGRGEAVFVVVADRARLVPVRTGRRGDRDAEVLEGLAGGEAVIAYPSDRVADGVAVIGR